MKRAKQGCVKSFDGTLIRYESRGEGLPFILIDGIGCNGYVWKYVWQHFLPAHRLVHVHYRGHGTSDMPKNTNNLTIENLADDIACVMDDDEIDRAVLIGHSMGCQVILEFARRHPQRCQGLVPMCGSYGLPLRTFHDNRMLDTLFPYLYPLFVLTPWVPEAVWRRLVPTRLAYEIATHFEINGRMIKHDDFMPYLEFIGGIDLRMFAKMLDFASRHTTEDFLPHLTVPVLIVAGEKDTFTPGWLSEKMRELIPNAELLMVPQGSHTAPIEMPQLVNLRLERWVLDHFGRQAESNAANG
ncbi:MAG: alpha/beta hydrolase [Myxococcales bacterium]|nr:alpha/beta hydrolase [Myxococcales bacterium]